MKFLLENYGCTLNQAQGEMISNYLISQGHQLVEREEEADSVLLSTCAVIKQTEDRMLKRIREIRESGKEPLVSGCLTHFPIEGVRKLEFSLSYGSLPILKDGDKSVGVPIAEGCDGGCTFCISRIARGRLKSFEEGKIVSVIEEMVRRGAKEIRLTALDTASYGQDSHTSLPDLIKRVSSIGGDFKIRIGMMEPENALKIMTPLLDSMRSEKVYKFLHIPFQSGDPLILRKMGRKYRIEEFLSEISMFRDHYPDGTLSTDIIVGFPFETTAGLMETLKVVKITKPEILNVTKYSPRPGTAAYGWKTPRTNQTSLWSQIISNIHSDISENSLRRFIGRNLDVNVMENGKDGTFIARDINYHPVVLKRGALGMRTNVRIIGATPFYLIGE
ncbi:MAG: radical SAM protein [Thermoplasmatales archaeon]